MTPPCDIMGGADTCPPMTTTPATLKAARNTLGWSLADMARALRLASAETKGGDRVREMESGSRPISGPVSVAVEAFLTGWRPEGWTDGTK